MPGASGRRSKEIVKPSLVAAVFTFCCLPLTATAQPYPVKTILVVSSSITGNSGDTAMRLAIPPAAAAMGQALVMENRTTAGGQVAAVAVKSAAPDGYTVLFMSPSHVNLYFLRKNPGFHPVDDFTPITKVIGVPSLFAISTSLPVTTMRQFIDYAKRNPGKIAYGSTGPGTGFHMIGEAFSADYGVSMLHVPYASGGVALPVSDLANERLQLYFPSYISLLPVLKTGNVRVLSIVDRARLAVLPDVPAIFDELPDYKLLPSWFGLLAPAGTPGPIVSRLQSEFRRALQSREVASKLEALGATPAGIPPEQWGQELRSSTETVGRIAKQLKLEPQ